MKRYSLILLFFFNAAYCFALDGWYVVTGAKVYKAEGKTLQSQGLKKNMGANLIQIESFASVYIIRGYNASGESVLYQVVKYLKSEEGVHQYFGEGVFGSYSVVSSSDKLGSLAGDAVKQSGIVIDEVNGDMHECIVLALQQSPYAYEKYNDKLMTVQAATQEREKVEREKERIAEEKRKKEEQERIAREKRLEEEKEKERREEEEREQIIHKVNRAIESGLVSYDLIEEAKEKFRRRSIISCSGAVVEIPTKGEIARWISTNDKLRMLLAKNNFRGKVSLVFTMNKSGKMVNLEANGFSQDVKKKAEKIIAKYKVSPYWQQDCANAINIEYKLDLMF